MKKVSFLMMLITFFVIGCSNEIEVPEEKDDTKSISISLNDLDLTVGKEATFTIKNDKEKDITSLCKVFVDGEAITGNTYTPETEGEIEVHATYKAFTSPKITLDVKTASSGGGDSKNGTYTAKALIHDFTGTWCGHCADAIYEVKELHDKYPNNLISVGVHTGSGPDNDGSFDYEKYNDFGVEGNPVLWFNNKSNEGNLRVYTEEFIANKKEVGLAIHYDLANDKVIVKVGYDVVSNNNKLIVYLVEDKLIADQVNYSNNNNGSPAYQKGNPIKNLEHNNVLRKILTERTGNAIPNDEIVNKVYSVEYSLTGKDKFKDIQNSKVIAFVVDSEGNALNAQVASKNENKDFD